MRRRYAIQLASLVFVCVLVFVIASTGFLEATTSAPRATTVSTQSSSYISPNASNATFSNTISSHTGMGGNPGAEFYFFGNHAVNSNGWEMPANTLISTTFTINQTLSESLQLEIYILAYQITNGTTLILGLYVDGQLQAHSSVDITMVHEQPATMLTSARNLSLGTLADFTGSTQGRVVSIPNLSSPLPSGTRVTLTAYVTSPVWVEAGDGGTIESLAIANSVSLPSSLPAELLSSQASTGVSAVPVLLNVGGDAFKG